MKLLDSLDISHMNYVIYEMSRRNPKIEYVRLPGTEISYSKLQTLVESAPRYTMSINTAAYYMKNLILTQCFPDGNHRTALEAVRLFYHINHVDFRWNPNLVVEYQYEIYKLRYKIYNTYEALPVSVLSEPYNDLWLYCRDRIQDNLSKKF